MWLSAFCSLYTLCSAPVSSGTQLCRTRDLHQCWWRLPLRQRQPEATSNRYQQQRHLLVCHVSYLHLVQYIGTSQVGIIVGISFLFGVLPITLFAIRIACRTKLQRHKPPTTSSVSVTSATTATHISSCSLMTTLTLVTCSIKPTMQSQLNAALLQVHGVQRARLQIHRKLAERRKRQGEICFPIDFIRISPLSEVVFPCQRSNIEDMFQNYMEAAGRLWCIALY